MALDLRQLGITQVTKQIEHQMTRNTPKKMIDLTSPGCVYPLGAIKQLAGT